MELVDYQHLSQEALAKIRRDALEMDKRAYEHSEVYRETPPAERIRYT